METQKYREIVDQAQKDYEAKLENLGIEIVTEAAARVAITGYAFAPLDEIHLRCDR